MDTLHHERISLPTTFNAKSAFPTLYLIAARMLPMLVSRVAFGRPGNVFTDDCWLVLEMHGGLKVYRGSPAAARSYVEADRGRADDYYLAEGTGVAQRYLASPEAGVRREGTLRNAGAFGEVVVIR